MRIIHISAELAPMAKVGGLADVVSGLSLELADQGHETSVFLPKYPSCDFSSLEDLSVINSDLMSFWDGSWIPNKILQGQMGAVKVYLIEPSTDFFAAGSIYGGALENKRYLHFCRTALECILKHSLDPHVLHLHDWHAAPAAPLYRNIFTPLTPSPATLILTIHNLAHQGHASAEELAKIGLMSEKGFNLLGRAIEEADHVTTVSPTYAEEILTAAFGCGLEDLLTVHKKKLSGVLNGIDTAYWNPADDCYLEHHFSKENLSGKKKVKNDLQKHFALEASDKPLIGCVSRLVPQKGIEQIMHAIEIAEREKMQLVLLGSSPVTEIQQAFEELQSRFASHPDIRLYFEFNEQIAHLIYGGSDLFIIPSHFEPCGLTQLIAMRYAAIPVARKTGGLADTVHDEINGYTYRNPENEEFETALLRAMSSYGTTGFETMMEICAQKEYSWRSSAKKYVRLYKGVRSKKRVSQ